MTYLRSDEVASPTHRSGSVVFPTRWTDPQCAAWVLDHPVAATVWDQNVAACPLLAKVESLSGLPSFVIDIAGKARKYLLSERQRAALASAVEQASLPKKRVESGRRLVEGRVVKLKQDERNSGYGYASRTTSVLKALVQCDGYRLYGTVPSALAGTIAVGDTLRVEAEVVEKEPGFGFFSRPRVAS